MNLHEALRGIHHLAFDSSPLIYLVEKHFVYFDRVLSIFQYVANGSLTGNCSTLALMEVLVQPKKTGNIKLATEYEIILVNSSNFELHPITTSVARRAAEIRARYNLRTPDALHVATAIEAGCDAFLTNDLGLKRITDIQVFVLDELTLDTPEAD
jgi:predicted nucleic acid-binding protein